MVSDPYHSSTSLVCSGVLGRDRVVRDSGDRREGDGRGGGRSECVVVEEVGDQGDRDKSLGWGRG